MQGFIKLHRIFREWEWYTEPNMVLFMVHCLLKANHKDGEWKGQSILAGQFVSGRKVLSLETGLSEKQIRTCINKLKSTGELAIKSFSKYSVFTLNSWEKYQLQEEIEKRGPAKGPAEGQQRATNKNEKNEKKLYAYLDLFNSLKGVNNYNPISDKVKLDLLKKIEAREKSIDGFFELYRKAVTQELSDWTKQSSWFDFKFTLANDLNFEKWLKGNYKQETRVIEQQKPKTKLNYIPMGN